MNRLWDKLNNIRVHYPTAFGRILAGLAILLVLYTALAALTSYLVEGNRDSCERGNSTRLLSLRKASKLNTALVRREANLEAKGEMSEAIAVSEEREAYSDEIAGLKTIADESGNKSADDAVTINCTDEWPKPLPWIGQ